VSPLELFFELGLPVLVHPDVLRNRQSRSESRRKRTHGEFLCHIIVSHPFRDSHLATYLGSTEDISTHGALIDEQMSETMAEAGISFLAAQFVLAIFIWKFSNPAPMQRLRIFPARQGLVIAALLVVGLKSWPRNLRSEGLANVYLTPPSADAMPIQVQAGQFAFYSAIRS